MLKAHERRHQTLTLLHICGNTTPVLEEMAETGAEALELDSKVDLAVAKARVGGRVCLVGNLPPTTVLLQGTPADVAASAHTAIDKASTGGGFILGSGCEVPIATPRENLVAMVRVAHQTSHAG